jgi:hypothetical protein
MKYKLVLGCLGVFFIMSVIVACGEGAIDPFSTDDTVAQLSTASLDVGKSINACLADPVCREKYESTETPPSSAQIPLSSSSSSSIPVVPGLSSSLIVLSSGGVIPPFPTSSSSLVVIVSSQSSGGISGTCAPDPAIAELGQQVTWIFTKAATLDPKDIIAATFDWTFAAGSEPTFSGQGASALKKTVSYNTSGSHTTTLSINGDTPMTCAPVQVNGAPITGCECTVDNPSPDVAAGGVATWSVTGCLTTANISGYAWAGSPAVPTTTFAHTFTAKGEVFTPTLSVYNDDNTVQPVTCPAATAIDATLPDYEMTASGNTAGITFEGNVDATIVMNLPETWHGETAGTCSFACQVNRGSDGSGSGAISGTVDKVAITGSDYVTAEIPITSTINGYALKLVVDVGTNAGVTCFLNW